MATRNLGKGERPPVMLGGTVNERLPLPLVHYPRHYGTFIAFSDEADSSAYLCECSKAAIVNYLNLRRLAIAGHRGPSREQSEYLDQLHLPDVLEGISLDPRTGPLEKLSFRRGICHRCNLTPPTVRYCHEMYGSRFVQYFGWYVNQAYLRFGILPHGTMYLDDVTPDEMVRNMAGIVSAQAALDRAWKWFRERDEYTHQRMQDPRLPEPEFDTQEIASHQANLRTAQRQGRQARRVLSKKIENVVREEFGFRRVGEQWTSETLLYRLLCVQFPESQILRHHRPEWLDGLELDIFMPQLGLALEYQGQQHFHPIEAWGGEDALRDLQERDRRKARLCRDLGITLIAVDYREPLTAEHIKDRLDRAILGSPRAQ